MICEDRTSGTLIVWFGVLALPWTCMVTDIEGAGLLSGTSPAEGRVPDDARSMSAYKDDELERLWSHGLHEDNMFIQRGNFFLVAESLMLVAYAGVLASRARPGGYSLAASHIIGGFGFALTGIWILISHRHRTYLQLIQQRMRAHFREYRDTRMAWRGGIQAPWWRKAHINLLLSYGVPGLAAIMWLLLIFLA